MEDQINANNWLTIAQAAGYINMSQAFIRKCVRNRAIPFVRIGSKALRFRRSDLDAWLTQGRDLGVLGPSKN